MHILLFKRIVEQTGMKSNYSEATMLERPHGDDSPLTVPSELGLPATLANVQDV